MQSQLPATVMYPPDRALFAPFSRQPGVLEGACQDQAVWDASSGKLALYLHIPFCETKCAFCDYATLIGPRYDDQRETYVRALLRELEIWRGALPAGVALTGLDFGGGTPMSLTPGQVGRLLDRALALFEIAPEFEVSFETTPTLAATRADDLEALRALGVRRISMGVQSTDVDVLRASTRDNHAPDLVVTGMEAIRAANFDLVNVDLMFAQLNQPLGAWAQTITDVIALKPDVVTTYDTVYKNRGISVLAARQDAFPAAWDYADGYDLAFTSLSAAGYEGDYGTVNFSAVPGRYGTSRYLEGRILEMYPYVGLGLYASSLLGDVWAFRARKLRDYYAAVEAGVVASAYVYALPRGHVEAKSLLLMMSYGFIDAARYQRRFGRPLEEAHGEALNKLVAEGLLRRTDVGYALTEGCFGAMPYIRAHFMPDDAIAMLERMM